MDKDHNIYCWIVLSLLLFLIEDQIDGAVLKHGIVLILDHSLHKRLCGVGRGVVLTLIAHASYALYLLVYAGNARLLVPNLESWSIDSHGYIRLYYCLAKVRRIIQSIVIIA